MIKKILDNIISNFRVVNLYEAKKNKKKLFFKNFKILKLDGIKLNKNKNIFNKLNIKKKRTRFLKKHFLLILYFKKDPVCIGWMYQGKKWLISEINKEINIKDKILLYDFFTFKNFRNRGYYTIILKLTKNIKTNKNFLIYCLSRNHASKRGIVNAKFKLVKRLKK